MKNQVKTNRVNNENEIGEQLVAPDITDQIEESVELNSDDDDLMEEENVCKIPVLKRKQANNIIIIYTLYNTI